MRTGLTTMPAEFGWMSSSLSPPRRVGCGIFRPLRLPMVMLPASTTNMKSPFTMFEPTNSFFVLPGPSKEAIRSTSLRAVGFLTYFPFSQKPFWMSFNFIDRRTFRVTFAPSAWRRAAMMAVRARSDFQALCSCFGGSFFGFFRVSGIEAIG